MSSFRYDPSSLTTHEKVQLPAATRDQFAEAATEKHSRHLTEIGRRAQLNLGKHSVGVAQTGDWKLEYSDSITESVQRMQRDIGLSLAKIAQAGSWYHEFDSSTRNYAKRLQRDFASVGEQFALVSSQRFVVDVSVANSVRNAIRFPVLKWQLDVSAWVRRYIQVPPHALKFIQAFRQGYSVMALFGWFPDDDVPYHLIARIGQEEPPGIDQIDSELAHDFENRLYEIEVELGRAYPEKRCILQEAFANHRDERYFSSTQAFLSIADGICEMLASHSPFSRDGRSKLAKALRNQMDDLILSPLSADALLFRAQKDRGCDFSGLNRHQVMHGESSDYGTRINSLKALSFLSFIHSVLTQAKLSTA